MTVHDAAARAQAASDRVASGSAQRSRSIGRALIDLPVVLVLMLAPWIIVAAISS